MKIRNEVKFGIFTLLGIALFVVGMKYLRGSKMFGNQMYLYAEYPDVQGLIKSNPVVMNGFPVGKVGELNLDLERGVVVVRMDFDKYMEIPNNFEAMIYSTNILGAMAIRMTPNDSVSVTGYHEDGDVVPSRLETDFFDIAENFVAQSGEDLIVKVGILATELNKTVARINDLLRDPRGQSLILATLEDVRISANNIKQISYHIDSLAANFVDLSDNTNRIVENIADNNDDIDQIISNTRIASDSIAEAVKDFRLLAEDARSAAESIDRTLVKIDTMGGTLGLLINDRQLYDNLVVTTEMVNKLVDNIERQPNRYVDDLKLYLFERRPPKEKKKKEGTSSDKSEKAPAGSDPQGPPRN